MDEQQASEEAKRGNIELGRRGVSNAFYIEVERGPGEWHVELRQEQQKRRWWEWVLDVIPPWP